MNITKETRKESYERVDKNKRYKQFLELLSKHDKGLTVREIMQIENLERNQVAPRMTELVNMGKVLVVGKKMDVVTGKNIAVYKVKDNVKQLRQNNVDLGYKAKCENCEYAVIDYNKSKIKEIFCKYLKNKIDLNYYKKIRVCNFFKKK